MFLRIEKLPSKKFLGIQRTMTFATIPTETKLLWKQFMSIQIRLKNKSDTNLYSIQVYDPIINFNNLMGNNSFIKWAAIEMSLLTEYPKELEIYKLKGGLYAVFLHKGLAKEFLKTMQFIFEEWLPNSIYKLDKREHFELLGEKYINNSPNSEEEVWIPICIK